VSVAIHWWSSPSSQDCRMSMLRIAFSLILITVLASCSALPPVDASQPSVTPAYGQLIAHYVASIHSSSDSSCLNREGRNIADAQPACATVAFNIQAYRAFEISAPRWVHASTGWNWLVCMRYMDGDHRRTYSFFIRDSGIVDARYDVVTDNCAQQQYVPFDVNSGIIGTARLSPIH
jgi:hypothetical protein